MYPLRGLRGSAIIGYLDNLYGWDPYTTLVTDIHSASQDLHRISSDVHSMRYAVWANTFLNFYQIFRLGQQEAAAERRLAERETIQIIQGKNSELLEAWGQMAVLMGKVIERLDETEFFRLEVQKFNVHEFVIAMGAKEFFQYANQSVGFIISESMALGKEVEPIADSRSDLNSLYSNALRIEHSVLPRLSSVAELLVDIDFKLEIYIQIQKASIDIRKMEDKQVEVLNETEVGRQNLESGKISLPFNTRLLDAGLNDLEILFKEMRDYFKQCGERKLLTSLEHEELAAWLKRVDYKIKGVYEGYQQNYERCMDFKRQYELNWFKN